jgi:hypothetical protein
MFSLSLSLFFNLSIFETQPDKSTTYEKAKQKYTKKESLVPVPSTHQKKGKAAFHQ